MKLRRVVAVAAIAAMSFSAFAVPAMGGPSVGKVYKVAKKALKGAKKAQRTARTAQSAADRANTTANNVAASAVQLSGIVTVEGPENLIFPGDAEGSTAFCPSGMRVVSGGGSAITGHANGMSASDANEARTAWFVVGGNTSDITGYVQAWAYCAATGRAVASGQSHAATRREVEAVEAKVRSTLRR